MRIFFELISLARGFILRTLHRVELALQQVFLDMEQLHRLLRVQPDATEADERPDRDNHTDKTCEKPDADKTRSKVAHDPHHI